MNGNNHIGSNFDDFLAEEGLLEEANAIAAKRVIAWQLAEAMKQGDTALTLDTLSKAAAAVGCTLRFELVAA
jgi:antitoxin HicB